jgi:glycosyltransferase involved in cell wall biosynthesis
VTLDIMLPFYGRFDHFREAVESVIAQTDPDWRMTVIDDVYPDRAPGEWLQSLGDDRITYVRNEHNLGTTGNFMKCVTLMTSERAVIMGCDDVMLPGYLERVNQLLAEYPTASIIQPGVDVIDQDGRVYLPLADRMKRMLRPRVTGTRVLGGQSLAANLLDGNWTYFPSLVWEVNLLKKFGFSETHAIVLDLLMLLDIVADGGTLVLDDQVVFRYRRHAESLSSSTLIDGSRFVDERELFNTQRERFGNLGWSKAKRAARRHLSSRLHALVKLPSAIVARDFAGAAVLTKHFFGVDTTRSV